ncbi:MAG: hypothetical protein ACJA01_004423, partial [Saprospiraceae bacterium]
WNPQSTNVSIGSKKGTKSYIADKLNANGMSSREPYGSI